MAQARARDLSAALALALLAGAAPAGGSAGRVDAAVRFSILGPLLEGAGADRRGEAAPALDRAVEAALRGDWGGAIAASGEARDSLVGRPPSAARRLAWGLRVGVLAPGEAPGGAEGRRVQLRFLPPTASPLPDFVEVRLRLEPFDAAPVPLKRFTSRGSDLSGPGDFVNVETGREVERASLVATVHLGAEEGDAPAFPVAWTSEGAARIRGLRERSGPAGTDASRKDLAATLASEIAFLAAASTGELPVEDFEPLATLERAESLAASLAEKSDPLPGERGEVRRAAPSPAGATKPPIRFRLWVPTAGPQPPGFPLLLLAPSAFETEASPFRSWAGGSLRDLAEARGVLVASISPEGHEGDPVEAVLSSIRRTHPVDAARIHLLGRGSGAGLVQRFASAHVGEIASVAILDGGFADETWLRRLASVPLVAGGSGRGPTAPASRAIAQAASALGVSSWKSRVLEEAGWFESSTPILREAIERAASVPRGEPR
jgi:dienelactone hydrolase